MTREALSVRGVAEAQLAQERAARAAVEQQLAAERAARVAAEQGAGLAAQQCAMMMMSMRRMPAPIVVMPRAPAVWGIEQILMEQMRRGRAVEGRAPDAPQGELGDAE